MLVLRESVTRNLIKLDWLITNASLTMQQVLFDVGFTFSEKLACSVSIAL